MLPNAQRTLHVASERVVVDGAPTPAIVELDVAPTQARVRAIHECGTVAEVVDAGHALIVPAPMDIHFHGAGGHVVPPGGRSSDIDAAIRSVVEHAGWDEHVPCAYEWVATLPVPSKPPAPIVEHVASAARSITSKPGSGCVGVRIEGLFLNPIRAGVWPAETFMAPDLALLNELHAACVDVGSALLVVDVAPELPGALALVERCRELGVIASLAHTDATWDQARAAIDAGATLATHTWNAMRPVAHRDPGVVAAVLTDPRVVCELICDGVHLHPGIVTLSAAASGSGRWIAVSDASPFAGCEPGTYDWAGTMVHHDGVALRDEAGHLAGSASLLDIAPRTLEGAGVTQLDAVLAIGADPRRVLDPSRSRGLLIGDPVWIVPTIDG